VRLPCAAPAEYSLTDDTYVKLLARVSERNFDLMTPDPRDNILRFYSDLSVPIERKRNEVREQGVLPALDQLRAVAPAPSRPPCTPNRPCLPEYGIRSRSSGLGTPRPGHACLFPHRLVWAIHMT
jgi:hypothetical protein